MASSGVLKALNLKPTMGSLRKIAHIAQIYMPKCRNNWQNSPLALHLIHAFLSLKIKLLTP